MSRYSRLCQEMDADVNEQESQAKIYNLGERYIANELVHR